MRKSAALFLLLFALSSAASADIIYQFTGVPFDSFTGNWTQLFGSDPTNITATVDVASPLPVTGGSVGTPPGSPTFGFGLPPGIISASISDGLRTFTADEVYLQGYGTTIDAWFIGGGTLLMPTGSGQRAITTEQLGFPGAATNFSEFQQSAGPGVQEPDASGPVGGIWTAVVTPEINTDALTLISGSLLLLGYWRRRCRNFAPPIT